MKIKDIIVKNNDRLKPSKADVADMASSVKHLGTVMQNIGVVKASVVPELSGTTDDGKWFLCFGQRRLLALNELNVEIDDILVRDFTDLAVASGNPAVYVKDMMAIENASRKDLTQKERVDMIQRHCKEHGDISAVADLLSQPVEEVALIVSLKDLSKSWVKFMKKSEKVMPLLSYAIIAQYPTDIQESYFKDVNDEIANESPAQIARVMDNRYCDSLSTATWNLDDKDFTCGPACTGCPFNRVITDTLFQGITPEEDLLPSCTKHECFIMKRLEQKDKNLAKLQEEFGDKWVGLVKGATRDEMETIKDEYKGVKIVDADKVSAYTYDHPDKQECMPGIVLFCRSYGSNDKTGVLCRVEKNAGQGVSSGTREPSPVDVRMARWINQRFKSVWKNVITAVEEDTNLKSFDDRTLMRLFLALYTGNNYSAHGGNSLTHFNDTRDVELVDLAKMFCQRAYYVLLQGICLRRDCDEYITSGNYNDFACEFRALGEGPTSITQLTAEDMPEYIPHGFFAFVRQFLISVLPGALSGKMNTACVSFEDGTLDALVEIANCLGIALIAETQKLCDDGKKPDGWKKLDGYDEALALTMKRYKIKL